MSLIDDAVECGASGYSADVFYRMQEQHDFVVLLEDDLTRLRAMWLKEDRERIVAMGQSTRQEEAQPGTGIHWTMPVYGSVAHFVKAIRALPLDKEAT